MLDVLKNEVASVKKMLASAKQEKQFTLCDQFPHVTLSAWDYAKLCNTDSASKATRMAFRLLLKDDELCKYSITGGHGMEPLPVDIYGSVKHFVLKNKFIPSVWTLSSSLSLIVFFLNYAKCVANKNDRISPSTRWLSQC
eukprot:Pompholyxophrys_sp_v1_NODE_26_length_3750_cov_7.232206.p4 type:complete len:140 gc:universal NODE_26_length_3750_cov_7.232206:3179-3598(+)